MTKNKSLIKDPAPANNEGIKTSDPPLCLKCDKKFKPKHKYNRLCPSCTNSNSKISHQATGIGWSHKMGV